MLNGFAVEMYARGLSVRDVEDALRDATGQPSLSRNAVELVIRRFDQHYQSMCGSDTLQSARTYLHVFAFVYRLTPFADDTPGSIAGRCPLELAGYDLDALPIRTLQVSSSYPHHHSWQRRLSQCRNGHRSI